MPPVTLDYQHPTSRPVRLFKRWWAVLLAVGVGAGVAALAAVWWHERPVPYDPPESFAKSDIHMIGTALDFFKIDMGRYPTAAEGLNALMYQPTGLAGWNGPYLKGGLSSDPWGRPYVYSPPKGGPGGGFVVHSVGRDGKDGTSDDVY